MSEPQSAAEKLSAIEAIKSSSHLLRGTIAQELVDGNDNFGKDNVQLLKFHGTYQQDDREQRTRREGGKSARTYIFMVRSRIPGGKLTSDQLLGELDICEQLAGGTLRITSRQGLQIHGVPKRELHATIRRINEIKLCTLAACGDVNRNVMCCPAPHHGDPVHVEMQALATRLALHFAPKTGAYHELWLRDLASGEEQYLGGSNEHPPTRLARGGNGQIDDPSRSPLAGAQVWHANGHSANGHASGNGHATNGHANGAVEHESIYGAAYLPRKFKMAVGLPGDNCVDMYANDLAFMAICQDWKIVGYNLLVGGSMGVTPSVAKTFPAVAKRLAFIEPHEAIDVATAIVKVQRDFGNRSDRKVARLKYLLANRGLEWFKAKVEEYYGKPLAEPNPEDVWGFDDHLGWHDQGDGRWFYGLNIENGRLLDNDEVQLKAALREVCHTFRPGIRLTSHQSILFTDLSAEAREPLEATLRKHGVKLSEQISNVRRWSMACVAYPTCGLSITEAERALPSVIDELEIELAKLGLARETFTVRMTGCPNGCARPYNCDIGLVGKTAGKYTVFLGGRLLGDRLNTLYKDLVPTEEIVPTLVPLLMYFKAERHDGETFGDFCHRKGMADLANWAEQFALQTVAV
ncbi:MAG: NADPH-dependent assimilatory sulfite reductase hemoprotein subunit [Pirellulales bacterium]|nr:NADPH-dependent assimilatory sulfite reductase hemoprotein subunit [Pirellulales bacterium]